MKEFVHTHRLAFISSFCALTVLITFYDTVLSAPYDFSPESVVTIDAGVSIDQAGQLLKAKSIIRSAFVFDTIVRIISHRTGIKSGDYLFAHSESVVSVALRLAFGNYGVTPVKVTIPEGFDSGEIASVLSANLIRFNQASFLARARQHEGYLFPDTYFISPIATDDTIVDTMTANFDARTATVTPEINAFGRPLSEVIIMASIVEEEAKPESDFVDAQKIAGILWKRLDAGKALQVDSPFRYAIGKTTATLTSTDLTTDSPYNTYVNKGLPPTPITNPGIAAILATVTPITTPYWFFLTGDDGKMHYATTFADHVTNKALYIK